jgi:type VI secretion system protein ImpK
LGDTEETDMSQPFDGGMDEPTVIGRRPVGVSRAGPARRAGASPLWPGEDASTPASPAREVNSQAQAPVLRRDVVQKPPVSASADAPRNPEDILAAAAAPLLIVVAHLRNAAQQADVPALRKEMAEQLRIFEERAARFGGRIGDVSAARYALAALVDEAVMTTPWGSASAWSTNSLLLEFHSETWGGEKVFAMVDRVRAEPQKYLALMKLLDVCLLLGFEGKYRVIDNGREQLTDLRAELGRLLRQHGRQPPRELSSSWQGTSATQILRNYLPLWVVFAIAGAIVLSSYGFVKWRVATETAPTENALMTIGGPG